METQEYAWEASLEEELPEFESEPGERLKKWYAKLAEKNNPAVVGFLGEGPRVIDTGIFPSYYGELLTWALKRYMQAQRWQVVQTLGYHEREPHYLDVETGLGQSENLLIDGQILCQKDASRIVVTVDTEHWRKSILVEGPASREQQASEFVSGVLAFAKDHNFYRGKKLEVARRLRFLDLQDRSWERIILDANTKEELRANTLGFLSQMERWHRYDIPLKRGVLLAGEPGTGKTIICRALMSEAVGITCLSANAYAVDMEDYLTDLFALAQDLSPCMVFIEDIDLIGQKREESGYQRGNALFSLLSALDGLEQKTGIVTIATTNCLEMLDKALSQRPSRFDRVITLGRPELEDRQRLVSLLCQKIPLGQELQEYVAHNTAGFTPAQVQEVIHGLVIELSKDESDFAVLHEHDIESIISRIKGRNGHRIGFTASLNHNGRDLDRVSTIRTV